MKRILSFTLVLTGLIAAAIPVFGELLNRESVSASMIAIAATSHAAAMTPSATSTPVGRPASPNSSWWDNFTRQLTVKSFVTAWVYMPSAAYDALKAQYKMRVDQNNFEAANVIQDSEIALSNKARADLLAGLQGYQYKIVNSGTIFVPQILLEI